MNLDAFSVMMKSDFVKGMLRVPAEAPSWQGYTTEISSDARLEDMAWLTPTSGIQLSRGYRRYSTVDYGQYLIVNRHFDDALRVPLLNILDDKIGGYDIAFADLGFKAKQYPGIAVLQNLNNAQSTLCYDGTNFISATHNQGGGTPGSSLPAPFVTGTSGLNLLNYVSSNTADGLTYKAIFMLTHETIKPLGFQWRMAPKLGTNSGSSESEENWDARFWLDLRLAVFFGMWQSCIGVNITNTPNLTDIQVIIDQVMKQFRSFTLPSQSPSDPPLYTHTGLKISSKNAVCVCSTGLEQLLTHILTEDRVGVNVAGSTGGITSNIYYNRFDIEPSGYLNSAAGT